MEASCNAPLQRNNEIKLTMMKQRIGLESQIVRANGNLKLNHGGSIPCQASCNTDGCKFYVRVVIESEVWPNVAQFKRKPLL